MSWLLRDWPSKLKNWCDQHLQGMLNYPPSYLLYSAQKIIKSSWAPSFPGNDRKGLGIVNVEGYFCGRSWVGMILPTPTAEWSASLEQPCSKVMVTPLLLLSSEDNLRMNCSPVCLFNVCGPGLHMKWVFASQETLTKLTRSTRDHYCSCIR